MNADCDENKGWIQTEFFDIFLQNWNIVGLQTLIEIQVKAMWTIAGWVSFGATVNNEIKSE